MTFRQAMDGTGVWSGDLRVQRKRGKIREAVCKMGYGWVLGQ